ncbi:hypothetical protein V6N13_067368 [Hibiscus sabdariffa]
MLGTTSPPNGKICGTKPPPNSEICGTRFGNCMERETAGLKAAWGVRQLAWAHRPRHWEVAEPRHLEVVWSPTL